MVDAIGGDITDIVQKGTNYRLHKFLTSSQLEVLVAGTVEYLIVGGGGSGGNGNTGGGGGGGRVIKGSIYLDAGTYAITVGDGGASQTTYNAQGNDGGFSEAFGINAPGGGGGGGGGSGGNCSTTHRGRDGGCSGGGGGTWSGSANPCAGDVVLGTYPVGHTPELDVGYVGGVGLNSSTTNSRASGGGGGTGGKGNDYRVSNSNSNNGRGGFGGEGILLDFEGVFNWYSAGGQGGTNGTTNTTYPNNRMRTNGISGYGSAYTAASADAIANTGSGGGGGSDNSRNSGAGGSGIVIIKYNTSTITPVVNPTEGKKLFTPTDLQNLRAWFDPSNLDAVTLNGIRVSELKENRLYSYFPLTNGTDVNRPVYANNAIGDLSMLRFGINEWLGNGNRCLFENNSIFMVVYPRESGFIFLGDAGTADYLGCGESGGTGGMDSLGGAGKYWMDGEAKSWTTRGQMYSDVVNKRCVVALINHTFVGWGAGFYLSGYNSSYWRLDGDIGEVLVVDGDIDQNEIDMIFGYLCHKWVCHNNLPAEHPYKDYPPTRQYLPINIQESISSSKFRIASSQLNNDGHAYNTVSTVDGSNTLECETNSSYGDTFVLTAMQACDGVWKPNTSYVVGDLILATTPESIPYYFERLVDGVSGATEPAWLTIIDAIFDENGVVGAWKVAGRIVSPHSNILVKGV